MVRGLLLTLLLAGCAYWVVAWWCVRSFAGRPARSRSAAYRPRVSVLKPVKGVDAEAYENFVSFCRQDYADYELLFGVLEADDPAVGLVGQLQGEFPERRIRLIVARALGANPKVSILHHLAGEAQGEVLVISDSDIRVESEYLEQVVAGLEDEGTGMVTCLYRGESPGGLAARLEGLHMDVMFLPSVLVAERFTGVRAGLGATMAVRKRDVERIGGFASIADYLADDYQLADRIGGLGLGVRLADCVVSSVLGRTRFMEQWRREVRWARTVRVSCPWGYPGLLITFTMPLALIAAMGMGSWQAACAVVAGAVTLRGVVAWRIMKYLGRHDTGVALMLLPAREVLSAIVWCVGLVGRRIVWRGQAFVLDSEGRLQPVVRSATWAGRWLRRVVGWVDGKIRQRLGIYEFSQRPECVLRISLGEAERDVQLADGTWVKRGNRIGEIHMWNEHIPPIPETGPDVAWAMAMGKRIRQSLVELAEHMREDGRFQHVQAFHARSTFGARDGGGQLVRTIERYGFEYMPDDRRPGFLQRCHDLGENMLLWGLTWAHNPEGLRGLDFRRERRDFWMSRGALMRRYGRGKVRVDDSGQ